MRHQDVLARLEQHVEEQAQVAVADELCQLHERTVGNHHRAVVEIQIDIRFEHDEDVDGHRAEQQKEESHQQEGEPPVLPENVDQACLHRDAPECDLNSPSASQRRAHMLCPDLRADPGIALKRSARATMPAIPASAKPASAYFVLPANPSMPAASGRVPITGSWMTTPSIGSTGARQGARWTMCRVAA